MSRIWLVIFSEKGDQSPEPIPTCSFLVRKRRYVNQYFRVEGGNPNAARSTTIKDCAGMTLGEILSTFKEIPNPLIIVDPETLFPSLDVDEYLSGPMHNALEDFSKKGPFKVVVNPEMKLRQVGVIKR